MRMIRELDEVEVRVLGALMEKEQATPEYYPMTVNALVAACNQKSNREPVTDLTETEVVETLDRLRGDVLAWRSDGARVERWSQSISRRLELTYESKAVLTLLMLRGPQTPGQLRSRSGRLHDFASLAEVDETLREMAAGDAPLAIELARQPGTKESRWAHRLGPDVVEAPEMTGAVPGAPSAAAPNASPPPTPAPEAEFVERLERVESRLEELAADLARLREELGS